MKPQIEVLKIGASVLEQSQRAAARAVVRTCLGLKEGDMLWIDTWLHQLRLAELLTLEAAKIGAVTATNVFSDDLVLEMGREVPRDFIRKPPEHIIRGLDSADAYIAISGPANPGPFFEKMPADKLAAFNAARLDVRKKVIERGMKEMALCAGFLTVARASTYGIDYDSWTKMRYDAMAVDYPKMKAFGDKVASVISNRSEAHVTSKAGTDLTMNISGRRALVDDGVVDEKDLLSRHNFTVLPTGVVSVAPHETSAEGTLVVDNPRMFRGKLIEGLRLTFKRGRIIHLSADRNVELLTEYLEKLGGDKDRIGGLNFGINEKLKVIGEPIDVGAFGTVSIGIGWNEFLGGTNKSDHFFSFTIEKPTVAVDGNLLMQNGRFNV